MEKPITPIDPRVLKQPTKNLTGKAKWDDIANLVARWERRNPEQARLTAAQAKMTREESADPKFGKLSNEGMGGGRTQFLIHPELLTYISAFYPKFMESKEDMRMFKKRFPQYRTSELS